MHPSELSSSPTSSFRFLDFPEEVKDEVLTSCILPSLHSRTSKFSLADAESAFDAVRRFEDDQFSKKTTREQTLFLCEIITRTKVMCDT